MVIVAILGFSEGNPQLVIYPYDTDGKQCGYGALTAFPYLYFDEAVSNSKSINVTGIVTGVCVSSCPSTYTGVLPCAPTTHNPFCDVLITNFYVSTSRKKLKIKI